MDALLSYNWPGNVRELRTAIEHGVVMATGPKSPCAISRWQLRQAAGSVARGSFGHESVRRKIESARSARDGKKLIMQALGTTNGNVTARAKKLGISRRTLHGKINEMNAAKVPAEGTAMQVAPSSRPLQQRNTR
jgi:DNA-binding NtrC family response regulator